MSERRPRFSVQTLTRCTTCFRHAGKRFGRRLRVPVGCPLAQGNGEVSGRSTSVIREGQISTFRQAVVVEPAAFQKRIMSVMMVRDGGSTICTAVVFEFFVCVFAFVCILSYLVFDASFYFLLKQVSHVFFVSKNICHTVELAVRL